MAGCHISQAWNSLCEVHTFFGTFGAQDHCYANLDKKFCCNKEGFQHSLLEQAHVLFPDCWMVAVPMQCYQRAWHPSVWTQCEESDTLWVLCFLGWKKCKLLSMAGKDTKCSQSTWSLYLESFGVCFIHLWINGRIPMFHWKALEITYSVVPPDTSQGRSSLGKYCVNFP